MNKVFSVLLIVSVVVSIFTGNLESLGNVMINSSFKAWDLFLQMGVLILFWGGLFQIAIDSGMIKRFSKLLKKPLHFIFPDVDQDSLAYELICSNMVANFLGLGSAATPLGLKAFKEMQNSASDKTVPTRSMITLIAINCSSITLIPTTIISFRNLYHGTTSINIILFMIASTSFSTFIAIILDRIFYKRSNKS